MAGTTRKGTQEMKGFHGGISIAVASFTTDGSGDPDVLTDPGGVIGVVGNISHSSGVYTVTLADGHFQVACIPIPITSTGHMAHEHTAFSTPKTMVFTTLTATGTAAGVVSAAIKLVMFLQSQ